jgi:multiple sugar transport system substrate-binding protein
MATIKDVAKEAGVSIATVSYFLNKKPVSEEKSKKIYEAIKKLNYFVNSPGRDLRTKNKEIGIIMPNIYEQYYEKIINSLKGFFTYRNRSFRLELSDENPESETKSLISFIGKKSSGIILYSCQPDNREVFNMLNASGIPFVLIDRKPPDFECNFVGCDNYRLFYNLTDNLIRRGKSRLALVCGPQNYTENEKAHEGFLSALEASGFPAKNANVIHTRSIRENGFLAGMQLVESSDKPPVAVLTTSYKLAEGLRYAFMINRIQAGTDVIILTSGDSEDDVFYYDPTIIKTSRPAFEIGETAGKLLLQNIKSPVVFEKQQAIINDTVDLTHLPEGNAPSAKIRSVKNSGETISLLLPDEFGSTDGLKRLLIDFYSKENISVDIKYMVMDDLYKYLTTGLNHSDSNVDVFLFDIPWFQELVEKGVLLCLDDYITRNALDTSQYVPEILEHSSRYNGHYYSLPHISSTQLLFYRKDLFNDEYLSQQFESQYKIPLSPPRDWLQYSTISKFFTRKYNPLSPVEYGNSMVFYQTTLFTCEFLPRLWSYGGDLYDKSGMPSLLTAPAKKALKNLLECAQTAYPDIFTHPMDTADNLIEGKAAMLITFFNFAAGIADKLKSTVLSKIGYTSIPGSIPVMGGWCLGINKFSRHSEAAFKFIKWATSADIAIPNTILGGQSPQLKTYRNYDLVSLYPWLPKGLSEFSKARKRKTPVKGNRSNYSEERVEEIIANELKILIQQAVSGSMPDADAIERTLYHIETGIKKST